VFRPLADNEIFVRPYGPPIGLQAGRPELPFNGATVRDGQEIFHINFGSSLTSAVYGMCMRAKRCGGLDSSIMFLNFKLP